ncbi:hypothetical protein Dfri01_67090 [Dyadobacter frigoris]|uniref:GxxExxY protein n=1 Tax=Dyadobacter frigoris TaxID=2576211 RepID=UPI00249FE12E|nr:GxxExxY protein [Dyadobacter frigoris]GLU57248.1 hypothetical protein Dfri01_67090 [Dyadobacter frigoris]
MNIIRPRLNDFFSLPFRQEDVDFIIPYIDEDVPFYIDPFLLWKSPSQQDNSLHLNLINNFNFLGHQFLKGNKDCIDILINCSECNEIGLGTSKFKAGKRIGQKTSNEILSLYKDIPQITKSGFLHFEEIQLFIDNIAEDRVSDITANFIKSFLIDYTIDQCEKLNIPIQQVDIDYFDNKTNKFITDNVFLPINPNTKRSILFVPKRWIRQTTFISYENYCKEYYSPTILKVGQKPERVKVLNFNRNNYDLVQTYIKIRELQQTDCKNDPLFKQIPVLSAKRRLDTIIKLPTGKTDNADRIYEDTLCPLLASLLYPHLDFAQEQSRTESGVSIRDLVFYNNCSEEFLNDIYTTYQCKQIVFELKNVKELNNDHVDQVNRYLKDTFGRFAIIFTRNEPPKKVTKNLIDLWSGQRKCILVLTDEDLKLMCQVFESKNRTPIDVIKKRFVEFNRLLPS